jgi:hypothetical protein
MGLRGFFCHYLPCEENAGLPQTWCRPLTQWFFIHQMLTNIANLCCPPDCGSSRQESCSLKHNWQTSYGWTYR